jgi:hypothetical protein
MFVRSTIVAGVALGLLALASLQILAQAPAATPTSTAQQSALRLNEFMADNKQTLEDPDEPSEFPDWIEIYNPSSETVSLKGLSLSDNPAEPARFPLTDTLTIPAGGYIIFYADNDPKQGARHTNFGLSSSGEFIGLFVAEGGAPIDTREFGPQQADLSEGRKPDGVGAWQALAVATPGKSNQFDPPVIRNIAHAPPQPQANDQVTVTATITDNGAVTAATLYYSSTGVSLTALPMVKTAGDSYTAILPGRPNGVLVNYSIKAKDNQNEESQSQTLGYLVGYEPPALVLNEVMAENASLLEDPDDPGEFPDWLEVYNPTAAPISLNGLSLSDNPFDPRKSPIPNGVSVPAGGFVVFYLDDDPEQGPTHTNFSLNKNGERIGLYGGAGTVVIDSLLFGQQLDNVSMGRYPDGAEWRMLVCATPNAANILCDKLVYLPVVAGK